MLRANARSAAKTSARRASSELLSGRNAGEQRRRNDEPTTQHRYATQVASQPAHVLPRLRLARRPAAERALEHDHDEAEHVDGMNFALPPEVVRHRQQDRCGPNQVQPQESGRRRAEELHARHGGDQQRRRRDDHEPLVQLRLAPVVDGRREHRREHEHVEQRAEQLRPSGDDLARAHAQREPARTQ